MTKIVITACFAVIAIAYFVDFIIKATTKTDEEIEQDKEDWLVRHYGDNDNKTTIYLSQERRDNK